ncbi:NAD-dependent epimerase/dehydratase family protein [Candidatus Micrarchaeota archaeon]|nr:NAD-dependent epimerase/dehydratase family protein [Candidatus Micrarchaeota archaeon]
MGYWNGKKVLITGGLGFIGSNLAHALDRSGAELTLIDDLSSGNRFNIRGIKKVTVHEHDFNDARLLADAMTGTDAVFHLAARTDHVAWREDPVPYVQDNVQGTLLLLDAWKKLAGPKPKIIHTGTRGEYGPQTRLPVSEDARPNPLGLYELTKWQSLQMMELYARQFGLTFVHARLTNVYGERARMDTNASGVINWFIRLAMDDEPIPVFGNVQRDVLYVADCVDALMALAETPGAQGTFNVGNSQPVRLHDAVDQIISAAGHGRAVRTDYSPERKAQEPGDFYPDIGKIRKATGWTPKTRFTDGLAQTIAYYSKNRTQYWQKQKPKGMKQP